MARYSKAHICQCLPRILSLRGSTIVTITGDRRRTGEQLVKGVSSLACGLLELGVRSGDIVAICALNSDWYMEWLLAVAFVGGIVAPLNYRWSIEEANLAMLSIRPVILVTDESCNFWYTGFQINAIPSLRWHVFLGPFSPDIPKTSNKLNTESVKKHTIGSTPMNNYSWAPEDAAIICFTSGTTGRPKGVIISHSAVIVQSLAKVAIVRYSEEDVYLHTAPLCHIGGLSSAMAVLMVGACHVFIPKFEATLAMEAIVQHHVTSLITVPAMMVDLVSLTRHVESSLTSAKSCMKLFSSAFIFSQNIHDLLQSRVKESWKTGLSVKKILNGGGSPSAELIESATRVFPRAKIFSAYGMTETCSSLTFLTLHDPTHEIPDQTGQTSGKTKQQLQGVCVGKPAPHVELKICSDGTSPYGRIITRGPHTMLGYWDQRTAKALQSTNEVWLDTGDVGCIDNCGNVWLIGRGNSRIKSGGENVHPEDVELILSQHPGVKEVVVVGIPDCRLTEMVVACITFRENWQWIENSCNILSERKLTLCSEILQRFCREKNLTGFKVPKLFILWNEPFPLATNGKIRREQLRKEVMIHLQSLPSKL